MSVLVAFSVTPLGTGEHVSAAVAQAIKVVRQSGLNNSTDAMYTIIEGDDLSTVMSVINEAVDTVAQAAPRVSVVIKMDYFPGRVDGMGTKAQAIEERLAQPQPQPPQESK